MKDYMLHPQLGYTVNQYFPNELSPDVSALGKKQITYPTKYENHAELEYIFVQSGSGTLFVNGLSFHIQAGDGAFFQEYDFQKFAPDAGETLAIDYFRVNTGTYMYAMSNPYQVAIGADFFQTARPHVHFQESECRRVKRLFARMHAQKAADQKISVLSVFFAIELIGLYNRELFKNSSLKDESAVEPL